MADRVQNARPPVRMVHFGLGAFHRAHQAWYTQVANESSDQSWGYESFTGRSPEIADALNRQGCRYHLVVRGPDDDTVKEISAITRASHAGSTQRIRSSLSVPSTALVTLTVTEAGYHLDAHGELDLDSPAVMADLESARYQQPVPLETAVGRLVDGLGERRARGGGPIALASCDNLSSNGEVLARTVLTFARALDPDLAHWIENEVSFVSTMVDRITPAFDLQALEALPSLGDRADLMPVVTEPFTEWILAGDFPAGRPEWEAGGARFVSDVAPFEERKLWILNAGHSLLAYLGSMRGHTTVAEAMTDSACTQALERLWDEAEPAIRLPREEVRQARESVAERWRNPRIEHLLRQISKDGLHKLRTRLTPVLGRWLEEGWGVPRGQLTLLGSWVAAVRAGVTDDCSAPQLAHGTVHDGVREAFALVAPGLLGNETAERVAFDVAERALSR